ncbi:MAG TPA: putative toxin-antitoxin system toxin component, PIN family [Vicinamibacterales bacterium]|nr:putative toxin-antitoxin system toxin component, PIN family [Vicinamibacterales bacterium]
MRVFLDTNVLASAIATRGLCADVLQVTLAEHQLVVGEKVLSELHRVLMRKFRASKELADEANEFIRREAEVIAKAPRLELSLRDADDLTVLEQAVAGASDVLVTGDHAFLEIDGQTSVRILSPRGFWDLLREDATDDE